MFAQITLRNSFQPDHVSGEKYFLAGKTSTFLAICTKKASLWILTNVCKKKVRFMESLLLDYAVIHLGQSDIQV